MRWAVLWQLRRNHVNFRPLCGSNAEAIGSSRDDLGLIYCQLPVAGKQMLQEQCGDPNLSKKTS
jgi:hypothetical protein